jgi:hypothetical protein
MLRFFRPRGRGLGSKLSIFDPLTRSLAGLWCFGTGHHLEYSEYANQSATLTSPVWKPQGFSGRLDVGDQSQYRFVDASSTTGITVEAIFQADAFANGAYPRIFSKLSAATFNGYELLVRSPDDATVVERNHIYFQTAIAGSLGQVSGPLIEVGKRYHVIVTKAPSGEPQIYVNGSLANFNTYGSNRNIAATSTPFVVGDWSGTPGGGVLNGAIEKVAVYSRTLNSIEIAGLFRDPYSYLSGRRTLYAPGVRHGSFSCEADWSFECEAESSGTFDCDASVDCRWEAPHGGGFFDCDASTDFACTSTPLGVFVCDTEPDVTFDGHVYGTGTFDCDASVDVRFLYEGGIVKVPCLVDPDGRFQSEDADFELAQNYAF